MATVAPSTRGGRLRRIRSGLTRREWAGVAGMVGAVVGLHVVGWVTLLALVVPHHYSLGTQVFGVGIGVTAYTLGLRHAFDADHIAAIDNTTRKLMADGKRPLSVGFFFSLGHSSVVFGLALLFSLGVKALARPGRDRRLDAPRRHRPRRHDGLRDVPLRDRGTEPRRPGRDRQGLPPDARGRATTRPSSRPSSSRAGS